MIVTVQLFSMLTVTSRAPDTPTSAGADCVSLRLFRDADFSSADPRASSSAAVTVRGRLKPTR